MGGETHVGVAGAGYVGLTTAACLARLGHHVTCADIDESKVDKLSRAEVPIAEPGLPALVREGLESARLRFTATLGALAPCDVVLLALPTPMDEQGNADLAAVDTALGELAPILARGCVLVTKSTVPVGTTLPFPRPRGRGPARPRGRDSHRLRPTGRTARTRRARRSGRRRPVPGGQGRPSDPVLTEWPEFRDLDWPRLATLAAHATVIDTRNLLDSLALARAGFRHTGTGLGQTVSGLSPR